ncbi:MAG: tRNA lysidine(34) synthetase TilS [Planctomycetaceae bacterium]
MTQPPHSADRPRADREPAPTHSTWPRLVDALHQHLTTQSLGRSKVLLAVSGGADSVAMLRLWVDRWQGSPGWSPELAAVAHYNHRLRGEASDLDERFVCELADRWRLRCYTQRAEDSRTDSKLVASEAALRKARYGFLQATAEKLGARCVLVAHTADDNVETMLHHLFRGSGTAGLAGIAPHRALGQDLVLIRPLLAMWRDDLRSGLSEIGQSWREDASNREDRYQRNWIRGTLLPLVRQRYPRADRAILRAIQSQAGYREWIEQNAVYWIDHNVSQSKTRLSLRKSELDLATLSAAVQLLWKRMHWPRQSLTAAHLQRIHAAVTKPDAASFTLPGDVQCRVDAEQIILRRGR